MPGMTNVEAQATLDVRFPLTGATDHIAYSTDGVNEFTNLARTPIGATGWAAATNADPSVKANANVLTSANVTTAGGTVTHYAIFSALVLGTQRIEWTALDNSRALAIGDSVQWSIGSCAITLT